MKRTLSPQEKKALSYERDHVNRSCENQKAWRKSKPLKKRKAVRSARKAMNDALRTGGSEADTGRRFTSVRQEKVEDFGVTKLRDHLVARDRWRVARVGLRKGRKTAANKLPDTTRGK